MEALFKNISPSEGSTFKCQQLTSSCFESDHKWHFHPEYELIWVVEGEGTQVIGDSISPVQAGDLVFIGPNLPHCFCSKTKNNEKPDFKWIVVQFKEESIGAGFLELVEAGHIAALFKRSLRGLKINGKTTLRIQHEMSNMLIESGFAKVLTLLRILDLLAESDETNMLVGVDYENCNDVNKINLRRLKTIQDYTLQNLGSDIFQPEIASKVGLTPQAFSRFFKKVAGITYVAFVNNLRVNKACQLLIECKLDITQVSFESGFKNISNFNRQFQKQKGKTPSDFRNMYRMLKVSTDYQEYKAG
ncbi:AraC family transcriptional regulator [Paraglaciecola sp.]|uniref:AraC family transcriptional regulator n=1 Tax=Paraglaciecola sp. TaxID=1920173 RepID=UPI003EFA25CC